ncbi:MAG: thioredoxin domain-containing protein [Terracidiphilus sp.]|nr:thioredoxin domain-containing protein [Terracidiphilus sp.]
MSHIRLLAVLLALCLTAGCKAQAPASDTKSQSDQDRRIEVLVRARFGLTPDIEVTLGARKPSNISGYETLPVTLSRDARSQTVEFLLSNDGKTLARLDTLDLVKDPIFGIRTEGRPIRGNPNAKVTVVSFDDLECPFCGRMHQALFPSTLNRYKDQIRFVYKDFPLLEIHPWAMHAAVDANCLNAQKADAYWGYVDYLHIHGDDVTGTDRDEHKSWAALDRIARQQGATSNLDAAKLDACLAAQDETAVRASLKEAIGLGLEGAPALFINGERINGALPEDLVWKAIDRALRSVGEVPPPLPAGIQPKPVTQAGQ